MRRFVRLCILLLLLIPSAAAAFEFKALAFRVQTNGPWCYVIIKDNVGLRCNDALASVNAVLNGIRDDVAANLGGQTVTGVVLAIGSMRAEIVRVATGGPYTCLVYKNDAPSKVTSGLATLAAAVNQARDDINTGLGSEVAQRGEAFIVSVAP